MLIFSRLVFAVLMASRAAPQWASAALGQGPESETRPAPAIPAGVREESGGQPWFVRALLVPRPKGMFIRLPIIDTDPNRGVTYGVMPIWVLNDADRIRHIHAPSLTYNDIFRLTPTYRYYHYPDKDSTLHLRGSFSSVNDREVVGQFDDYDFLSLGLIAGLKLEYNVDGANRFFGIGPDTPKEGEANYSQDSLGYRAEGGFPLDSKNRWHLIASHRFSGDKISNGPVDALPDIDALYPNTAPAHRHQHSEFRLSLSRDTRDSPVTTSRGHYAHVFAGTSQRALGGEYRFQRYGAQARLFLKSRRDPRFVTASQLLYEQAVGPAPFWLLPQLGGKYVHRAYGEGRYIDQGIAAAHIEERFTFFRIGVGGVSTEFELAPFAGVGSAFETPRRAARKYFRPVFGGAVRAVAKPQVVGSVDFGLGQEGLSAFMDINYSF